MTVLNGFSIYCHLTVDELVDALKVQFPGKEIQLTSSFKGLEDKNENVITVVPSIANDKQAAKLKATVEANEQEQKICKEKEQKEQNELHLYTIQSLQKQQQALYDEFVLLRERYDEQKASLLNILWYSVYIVYSVSV